MATPDDTVATDDADDTLAGAYARAIEAILKREKTWVSGADLAKEIGENIDPHSGTFTRAIKALKLSNIIESKNTHGYRLKPPDSS